jgi:hypothetical protein
MIVDIARRGLSHPNAVAYMKRAVAAKGDQDMPDVPVWGVVLIYATFMITMVGVSLVSRT